MDNSIQVFNNEDYGTIRALKVNGDPWFVAKDICDALGIATNHLREEGRGLDDDEVATIPNWEGKGAAPLIVSEAGMYSLMMRSRKPEAKAFKRWVTSEVLPSIRKTGRYELPQQIPALAMLNEEAEDTLKGEKKVLTEKPTEPTEKPTEPTEKPTEVYDVVSYTHWMN